MLLGHLYVFFGEMSIYVFCPFRIGLFVFLILRCMSCLYTLEINLWSIDLFANIFSRFEGCLFVFFMVSFAVQKFLSFIRSHLFIFVFISITLDVDQKRSCCDLCQRVFFLCFHRKFSKSFLVSALTFRSLIHFEFIFVYGVRECSNFILFYVAVQFSQHHLLKRLSFLHCISLPPSFVID